MSLTTTGIIGIIALVILLYSKMPVGFAMGFVGLIGFSYVVNFNAGLNLLVRDVWDVFSSYNLTVIPLFVFMGQIAFYSGISRRLYDSAYVLLADGPPPRGSRHDHRGCLCRILCNMRLNQCNGSDHGHRCPS